MKVGSKLIKLLNKSNSSIIRLSDENREIAAIFLFLLRIFWQNDSIQLVQTSDTIVKVARLAISSERRQTFIILVLFSISNSHWYGTTGPNFSIVAVRPRLIIDKNNVFVAAFSKADDVATNS